VLALFAVASGALYRHGAADLYTLLAGQEMKAGRYRQALVLLDRALAHCATNPDSHYARGESLYALAANTSAAAECLELLLQARSAYAEATRLEPLEGNAWLGLAQTCWWLSRFEGHRDEGGNAGPYFENALEIDPNNGKFLFQALSHCLDTGDPGRCRSYLERLALAFPMAYQELTRLPGWNESLETIFRNQLENAARSPLTRRDALTVLTRIAAARADWARAIRLTRELLAETDPGQRSGLLLQLGRHDLKTGDLAQAKAAFLDALKEAPNRRQGLQGLLRACLDAKALPLYLELCEATARFDGLVRKDLPLLQAQGYLTAGEPEPAALLLRRYLETGESAEARAQLAELALRRKDWDTAELESQRATVLVPKNGLYHDLFIRSLQAQGKTASALEAAERAARQVDQGKDRYFSLQATLHWQSQHYRPALEAWQAAHELAPRNSRYLLDMARAHRHLGDRAAAEHAYTAALAIDPADPTPRAELQSLRAGTP